MNIRILFPLFCALLFCCHTEAAKLFSVSTTYNEGADTLMVENSSLPKLLEHLIKNYGNHPSAIGTIVNSPIRKTDALHLNKLSRMVSLI